MKNAAALSLVILIAFVQQARSDPLLDRMRLEAAQQQTEAARQSAQEQQRQTRLMEDQLAAQQQAAEAAARAAAQQAEDARRRQAQANSQMAPTSYRGGYSPAGGSGVSAGQADRLRQNYDQQRAIAAAQQLAAQQAAETERLVARQAQAQQRAADLARQADAPAKQNQQTRPMSAAELAAMNRAMERAIAVYPDVTKASSALMLRMQRIDTELERDHDPLFFSPEKYFTIAGIAAKELGIAPRTAGSTTK